MEILMQIMQNGLRNSTIGKQKNQIEQFEASRLVIEIGLGVRYRTVLLVVTIISSQNPINKENPDF